MDKVIYTGKATKEDIIKEIDKVLSRLIDELKEKSIKIGVDGG